MFQAEYLRRAGEWEKIKYFDLGSDYDILQYLMGG
jgi:hypothetical protein